jgi:predicted dehydrogenase
VKRLAVVGVGKMGLLHASLLSTIPDVQLVALCEKNPLVRKFCRRIIRSVEVVGDITELSAFNLDAIYVTTPASSHFPIIKTIYTKKIARDIFVEKPLASNYSESEQLCNFAKGMQSVTMVGYNRRFGVTFKKAKEILDEGTLGELFFFEGYAYSSDFIGNKSIAKTLAHGGALKDLGCHAVDAALWFFNEFEVQPNSTESQIDSPEDFVRFSVKTPKGLNGEIKSSRCMPNYRMPEIGLIVKGNKGILKVNDDKLDLTMDNGKVFTVYRQDLDDNTPFFLGGSEYYRENEIFVQSILDRGLVEPNFAAGARVERVINQANEMMAKNGR